MPEAAKRLVLIVEIDRRVTRYVLAVAPRGRRVDLNAIRTLFPARYVGFRDAATAERLAHGVPGTVLPFSFDPELELVADPGVIAQPCLTSAPPALIARRPSPARARPGSPSRAPNALRGLRLVGAVDRTVCTPREKIGVYRCVSVLLVSWARGG